jgi:hypothetical protein
METGRQMRRRRKRRIELQGRGQTGQMRRRRRAVSQKTAASSVRL